MQYHHLISSEIERFLVDLEELKPIPHKLRIHYFPQLHIYGQYIPEVQLQTIPQQYRVSI
ncbi:hypothetical protein D3C72_1438580 [compost metagenome]